MAPIAVPAAGLPLSDYPTEIALRKNKARQAIEVVSAGDETMEQIISRLRKDGVDAVVSLGKKPAMVIDRKAFPLQTLYQPQGLLFKKLDNSAKLQLSASLNLKDALARIRMATSADIDLNDPAILALQQSFAQAKEQKDANKAIFVKDSSKLPPAKGGKGALGFLKDHRRGMFGGNSTTRSLPASPSLGGVTPQPAKRDARAIKQEALKISLIHLLAVRPVSERYMISALNCAAADLKPLLDKYGRESPFDQTKFNLSDKGYKELDVWKFPYKDESDRQGVIERAIAAFDRQRVSVVDPLWQKLLPKDDRNKGKVLSKLKSLHDGPVERVKTPRIQVEASVEEGVNSSDKQSEEEKRGRLAPADAHARSRSQDPLSKKKVSEREAQSKRQLLKEPKKAADMAKPRAIGGKEKKAGEEKKPSPKKAASKATTNTSSKVKSAEFVHDSDEEIESDEIAVQASQLSQQPSKRKAQEDISPASKKPAVKKAEAPPKPSAEKKAAPKVAAPRPAAPKGDKEKPAKKAQQPESKKSSSAAANGTNQALSTSTKKRIPESQRPVAMARSLSYKRSGNSPVKPSPLGSSPPTNASDLEGEQIQKAASSKSSSSSGSPLINQRRERLELAKKNAARSGPQSKVDASPNGASDRAPKRRANDIDASVHPHGAAPVNGATAQNRASKRPRMPESPPSTSDDSDKGASSNTSPSEILSPKDLEYARTFKLQLAKYNTALRELQALSDPPADRVEKLHRMHQKLVAHKAEIWKLGKAAL